MNKSSIVASWLLIVYTAGRHSTVAKIHCSGLEEYEGRKLKKGKKKRKESWAQGDREEVCVKILQTQRRQPVVNSLQAGELPAQEDGDSSMTLTNHPMLHRGKTCRYNQAWEIGVDRPKGKQGLEYLVILFSVTVVPLMILLKGVSPSPGKLL